MTYDLAIGDRAYSSWSLRGWLLFDAFGLPVRCHTARLYTDELPQLLEEYAPARTVPAMKTPEGYVVWDTLAMCEHLAEAHPGAGLWPKDAGLRALARSIAAEMHSSYGALREACPMNLRVSYADFEPSDAVKADLARIEKVWSHALARSGGPWLCGEYSVADVMFAPVAGRIAGYGLQVGPEAQAYVDLHLAHPSFRRWRAMGLVDGADQEFYRRDFTTQPWPGPAPLSASALETGPSVNEACPYSGKPVEYFLELDGTVYGFCNAFCRNKTVADPEAWPKFSELRGA